MSGTPELEPVALSPEHQARVEAAEKRRDQTERDTQQPLLADVTATARRLVAASGAQNGSADLYGDHCVNPACTGRWALPADKATCPHRPICEDCWPNGCDDCIAEVEAEMQRRASLVNGTVAAAESMTQAALDLSTSDLAALDWRQRADLTQAAERGIEALRQIADRTKASA